MWSKRLVDHVLDMTQIGHRVLFARCAVCVSLMAITGNHDRIVGRLGHHSEGRLLTYYTPGFILARCESKIS